MKIPIAAAILLTSIAAAAPARAESPSETMRDATRTYLEGEKAQGFAWGGTGLLAIGIGTATFATKTEFGRGLAYPLGIVGLIQLVYGIGSIARADGAIAKNEEAIARDASGFQKTELARIGRSNTLYVVVEIVEGVLVAGGTTLAVIGATGDSPALKGVGAGLAIQGAAMLTLDRLAHLRALRYESALAGVRVTPLAGATGLSGACLSYGGSF